MDNYYQNTSIDTEVIIKSVAAEVKRNQDYIIYKVIKRQKELEGVQYPPEVLPVVQQAQSTVDILLMVKLQEALDDLGCKVSFDREVNIESNSVLVSAVCYESEQEVKLFKRKLDLPREIIPEKSTYKWDGDDRLILELKKADGPSYWPQLLKEKERHITV